MPSLYSRGSVWCWCCWSTGSSARRALGNLIGNCVATVVVAAWEGDLDRVKAKHVLDGDELVDVTAG